MTTGPKTEADHGIPDECCRVVPTWLVLLDNIPTGTMFVLGALLLLPIWWLFSVIFLIYCGLSIILFWALICPYCHHYNSKACPCGYGVAAPKLFKYKGSKEFKKVFKQNIVVMFPCWFVPFGAGIYLLMTDYSQNLFVLFLAFCIVGFALIPAISKYVGCKGCEIKDQCPWMT